ncbi:hypothetical protein [Stenotrophomonas sp. UBA7606]|uniref:hypothetical protein n=1 Tax=Stenotrophomonas sp. UBA7606 TaxID=1947559 RepID=UPI0025F2D944|nr:hypothetical protein [Stenotrophomonas sp. UBA7606]
MLPALNFTMKRELEIAAVGDTAITAAADLVGCIAAALAHIGLRSPAITEPTTADENNRLIST